MNNFIELEQKYSSGLYTLKPFIIENGEGVYLYTKDGKKYLDFMSGHGVACLGHSHPNLIKAINSQAKKVITLHSSYPSELRAKHFKLLADISPKKMTKSFLVNSGTEAIEGAIKLALANNRDIKNPNIIAMKRSFHGRTFGSLSLTFDPMKKKPFLPYLNPNIKFGSFNNLDSVRSLIDENTIAIITELVQGEGGVHPASINFAKGLRELCSEKDILLIIDEVQTGMGRCGEMFACQHYKIEPDIMCVAKGIAGGVPMGAVISSEEIYSKIKKGEHASTFGGNLLAVSASIATIETLNEENLPDNAKKMGNLIIDELNKLSQEKIREIRGLGLLIGIQFKAKMAPYLKYSQEKDNILFLPAGMTVLRMLPPLIINESHVTQAISSINSALIDK